MPDVNGWTAPGWEAVRRAFQRNLDDGQEIGAAFGAYHRGQKVVDLWGGVADQRTGRPWAEDSVILVFSTTKGATAVVANQLIQDGRLDPDAPVAEYWPEFAENGKADIPVSYLLAHRAGLAWIDGTMTTEDALAWEPVVRALERQAPVWEPGTKHGYHATTYGWLVGEVVRRVTGKSLGTAFAEQVAAPLDLSFWIGLPADEEHRVVPLVSMIPEPASADGEADAAAEANQYDELLRSFLGADSPLAKALFAPGGALADQSVWNSRAMRGAEVPAANGVGDARSLARMYGACVSEIDGVRLLSPDQVKAATVQQTRGPNYVLLDLDIQFGLGFMLHAGMIPLGGANSFGHFGAGGSVGWADTDAELGMGYVMNRMDIGLAGDLRSFNLINACYESLEQL